MLIYEVNLEVEEEISHKVAGWLLDHIQQMLENKGFKAGYWFFRRFEDEGREPEAKTLWTIQYVIEDRADLEAYLTNKAAATRQEAVDKFGDKMVASRRVLNLLNAIGGP
jgi:hypothetical protein